MSVQYVVKQMVVSSSKFPALFVSHGAPDLYLHSSPARTFLSTLGKQLGKPKSILVVSAHWGTPQPMISIAEQPQTLHDFGGFDRRLSSLTYTARGAPDLGREVKRLLWQAKSESSLNKSRGLDHGAWSPLMMIYPDADIPVTQLSIQPNLSPEHHFRLGKAIASLRNQHLIIASGSATHNLRELGKYTLDAAPPEWVKEFSDWLSRTIVRGNKTALFDYRHLAPYAEKNHPTPEHFLPLFVAMGAGGSDITELHSSYTYGVLSMATYAFN